MRRLTNLIDSRMKKQWPVVSKIRDKTFPVMDKMMAGPLGGYSARPIRESEFVGQYDITAHNLDVIFRHKTDIYPDNLAGIKWRKDDDVEFEYATWAYRPDGYFSKWQTHIIIFEDGEQTVSIYAHKELNPFRRPVKHYRGTSFDAEAGVDEAETIMNQIKEHV